MRQYVCDTYNFVLLIPRNFQALLTCFVPLFGENIPEKWHKAYTQVTVPVVVVPLFGENIPEKWHKAYTQVTVPVVVVPLFGENIPEKWHNHHQCFAAYIVYIVILLTTRSFSSNKFQHQLCRKYHISVKNLYIISFFLMLSQNQMRKAAASKEEKQGTCSLLL